MQPHNQNASNTLMMTDVLRNLPTAQHNTWVCSAGPKGYCAVKEMLQDGIPGHTLLIESGDLRDVDASSMGAYCLVYYVVKGDPQLYYLDKVNNYNQQIPPTATHASIYTNKTFLGKNLLAQCMSLKSIDLGPLLRLTEVHSSFLFRCSGLAALDLSPLSQVTVIQHGFLEGCTGLTALDLSPLSRITVVLWGFLQGCTGLTALDLSPLSQVTEVGSSLLGDCDQITTIDGIPPLCVRPPLGWVLKEGTTKQWVRDASQFDEYY